MKSAVLSYLLVYCAVLVAGVADARAAEDLLIADFEGADYGQWKTTGNAFGQGPGKGKVADQRNVTGFQGKGLANSYPGCDGYAATGTLTSPPIKVERMYDIRIRA